MRSQEDIAPTNYKCDICKDEKGWTEWRDADVWGDGRYVRKEQVWVDCSCTNQRKIEGLINSSHITEEFQKMRFNNFDIEGLSNYVKRMKEKSEEYFTHFKNVRNTRTNSIALIGQPGVGKTHLLMAVSNNLITKGSIPVMYFPFVSTIAEMQANTFEKEEAITQRAKEVEVLFIDDLYKPAGGKPQATEWQQRKVYDIVNHRYLNNLPILLSSELQFPEMLAVDEATGSRLFEMTENYTVSVPKNFRLNYRTRKLFKEAN
ncbi:DnaA ATPase domain-containing protein [Rummeliibacillus pycnus]|uniref:DnaA ATPase domain-containing protein n=1 Tax=Rummeliibacillus pycnus TaxID=101070 RepID=UPI0037C527F6